MPRIRPCELCKRKRRKCERAIDATTCLRCSRLKVACILDTRPIVSSRYNISSSRNSTTESDNAIESDLDSDFEDLCQYVKTLEEEMKQLQLDLDQQKQQNTTVAQQQQYLVHTTTSGMESTLLLREWNLTFVNGHLRLETGINSISDLLRYRQLQMEQSKPIRYLSPLSNTPVRFEMKEVTVVFKIASALAQQGSLTLSQGSSSNNYTYQPRTHHHETHIDHMPTSSTLNNFTFIGPSPPSFTISSYRNTTLLPSSPLTFATAPVNTLYDEILSGSTSLSPDVLVDILVQQYFLCYNEAIPLLHRSTFMAKYSKPTSTGPTPSTMLDPFTTPEQKRAFTSPLFSTTSSSSPSSSSSPPSSSSSSSSTTYSYISQHNLITLAICCFMSTSYCKHLALTTHQKRQYGEYFYLACRQQIEDLYDDPSPHRQLEAMISINFLYKFATLTLRLGETRKLASLGYMLSVELTKYGKQPDTLFNEVEKEILLRNAMVASFTFFVAEFVCVQRIEDIPPGHVRYKFLPGESETTVSMLKLYGYMCDLIFHYDCRMMIQEMRHAIIGQVGHVTLEAMVRFEQKCLDWWKNLDKRWRYCENPFDSTARFAIEISENEEALMAHSYILVITLGVHTTLIYPQNNQDQVADMIQNRAVMMTLNCTELLTMLTARMKKVSRYCGYTSDYLLHVFDALLSLFNHAQKTGNKRMIPVIMKHINLLMNEVNELIPMDNRPSGAFSPSFLLAANEQTPSYDCLGDNINPSVYTKYPLPAHAILFDIINSTAKNIGGTLF